MRKILLILGLAIASNCYAQKYVEYISEPADSMALISKKDIDVVNNVFNERDMLDSLHNLNEQIISALESEIMLLDSIIVTQDRIIINDSIAIDELKDKNKYTVEKYSKELKKEKAKKISFQTTTGVGIIVIILILLL